MALPAALFGVIPRERARFGFGSALLRVSETVHFGTGTFAHACQTRAWIEIEREPHDGSQETLQETMFRLIVNTRRGSASGMLQAWARYAAVEDARRGAQELLRDDRVLRVMIARNSVPPSYVEWVER